ncbi:asparaginase [Rubrobacter taiwanensis]|uniref:asparaginase n=1 Tax=Rubrobacter taiwanensis TaxID=185139 RepID=UPI001A9D21FC|nr:asparaginase [Rubrobacter taiwanensis]
MKPPEDVPLAAVRRGEILESVHRGRLVVADAAGEVLRFAGDPDGYVCLRSAAKPIQALPTVFTGAAGAYALTGEELAVTCASHGGEPRHVAAVRSILKKAGLSERHLRCGGHPPLHAPSARDLFRSGGEPSAVHDNCSGKHAGMLLACVHNGWDVGSYRSPDHPLQRLVLRTVARCCGAKPEEVRIGVDGCGVPVFALPLRGLAAGFARLATGNGLPEDLAEAAARVRAAMRAHPFMVAGTGRLDTEVMRAADLISKGGAEGVLAVGSPEGWGLAVKVSDGAGRAAGPAAAAALAEMGVKLPRTGALSPGITNRSGEVVGALEILF